MKIVVIGGGVIGLGIAWRLAREGASVTLLERNPEIGHESSWAAAGMLAPLAEVVEIPGPFFEFGLESLRLYSQFLAELKADDGDPPAISEYGVLRLAFDQPALRKLESQLELGHKSGLSARILTPDELFMREPSVTRSSLVLGALLSEDERHIDPRKLTGSLVKAAVNTGAEIVYGADVVSIERGDSLIVKSSKGDYKADKIVLANGSWAANLAKQMRIHLPIYPRKGQVIALRPPEGVKVEHTVYSHQTYLVPRDGRILVGATQQDIGFDRSVTDSATERLKLGADALIPGLKDAEVLDAWTGFRPASADNLPIIGALDSDPRIYFAVGHQRNGVLLTPVTAESVCDEVLSEKVVQVLTPFRPNRLNKFNWAANPKPVVLVIAGSDPSGGAGIQADQRVIESLGCEAVCVATALTSQNSHGVAAVFPVPIETLRSQIETLLADIRPDSVKIGLLPSAEHVELIAELISAYQLPNVVLDPVIAPTYGQPFLYESGIDAVRQKLLPLVTLVTPNIQEATELTGLPIADEKEAFEVGRYLVTEYGVHAALIKGGHSNSDKPTDLLAFKGNIPIKYQGVWINTKHTHGTGCYLSAGIAGHMALGDSIGTAISRAHRLLLHSLLSPRVVGSGHGSPGRPDLTKLNWSRRQSELQERLRGIYYVMDDRQTLDEQVESVRMAMLGGVRVIQFRHKQASIQALVDTAHVLRKLTNELGALLIVNDRVDIALACNADGVHIGPDDMSPADARRVLGPDKLLGVSAGSLSEFNSYKWTPGAKSYVGCGPVFGTSTKTDAGDAIGIDALRRMVAYAGGSPVVAIGGITLENVADVHLRGVACAAVVGAISKADDPAKAAATLVELWSASEPPPREPLRLTTRKRANPLSDEESPD